MRITFLLMLCFHVVFALEAQKVFMLVGGYDSPSDTGIHVFEIDPSTAFSRRVGSFKTSNPSFLAISGNSKYVYAVEETASKEGLGGRLNAFSFDPASGKLSFLNQQHTMGDHPCHVSIDRSGRSVFISNYSGGNFSVFRLLTDGSAGTSFRISVTGSGPHQRQRSSHPHSSITSTDNRFLLTADLGADKIRVYKFDAENFSLALKQEFRTTPGAGPRILSFSPGGKFLYAIEELSGFVSVYRFKNGKLKLKQRISTMAAGDTSFPASAHVAVSADGKFLYASNRGTAHNIAIYSVEKNGKLKLLGHHPSGGRGPRHFAIDPSGRWLAVANQLSNEVVIFERNMETGLLINEGRSVPVGRPTCINWVTGL